MRPDTDYLILGEILRPHGVKGELRMRILTDFPERLPDLETLYLGKSPDDSHMRPYELESVRFHRNYALLKLRDVPDRNQAEVLRGLKVMIDRANAVPLDEGEYYLYQLIDMRVQLESGTVLGTIKDVMETGANDVYVLNSPQYGELLIPAHDETIVTMDFDEGVIVMTLPEGLLPET